MKTNKSPAAHCKCIRTLFCEYALSASFGHSCNAPSQRTFFEASECHYLRGPSGAPAILYVARHTHTQNKKKKKTRNQTQNKEETICPHFPLYTWLKIKQFAFLCFLFLGAFALFLFFVNYALIFSSKFHHRGFLHLLPSPPCKEPANHRFGSAVLYAAYSPRTESTEQNIKQKRAYKFPNSEKKTPLQNAFGLRSALLTSSSLLSFRTARFSTG